MVDFRAAAALAGSLIQEGNKTPE